MNVSTVIKGNGATLKLVFIAVLSLVMTVPLLFVRSIISERQDLKCVAERAITKRWGGSQLIGGLVAITNTAGSRIDKRSIKTEMQWHANMLSGLSVSADLTTQWRYLGVYQVPVYTARLQIKGRIEREKIDTQQPEGDLLFWLPLGDVHGLRKISTLKVGVLEIPAKQLGLMADKYSGLQFLVPAADRAKLGENYSLEVELAGSRSLQFLPLADSTNVLLTTDWPHPEFIGQFSPAQRNINADGSRANWQLPGLNLPYGDQWAMSGMTWQKLAGAGFGMRIETPVDGYQRSERSVKYGLLFIILTFFTLFLFEVLTGRPLHPVPYLLTGAALAVFYLVLLALSEYLSFSWSFALASGLLVMIITPYTSVVLGGRSRGYLVGTMMSATYLLLYVLVSAQHLALLLGSLALLTAIAGLMYLTRNVDWYNYGTNE